MSASSANKGSENPGAQRQIVKVETVDFYSSAGQDQEQVQRVQVVHQLHSPPVAASNTSSSSSILANAAASVASTLQSAKDAISGK